MSARKNWSIDVFFFKNHTFRNWINILSRFQDDILLVPPSIVLSFKGKLWVLLWKISHQSVVILVQGVWPPRANLAARPITKFINGQLRISIWILGLKLNRGIYTTLKIRVPNSISQFHKESSLPVLSWTSRQWQLDFACFCVKTEMNGINRSSQNWLWDIFLWQHDGVTFSNPDFP